MAALETSGPLGDTFGPLDGLMGASWSFLEAPWAAKAIFERFGSDFDSQIKVQFGPKILKSYKKTYYKSNDNFHMLQAFVFD